MSVEKRSASGAVLTPQSGLHILRLLLVISSCWYCWGNYSKRRTQALQTIYEASIFKGSAGNIGWSISRRSLWVSFYRLAQDRGHQLKTEKVLKGICGNFVRTLNSVGNMIEFRSLNRKFKLDGGLSFKKSIYILVFHLTPLTLPTPKTKKIHDLLAVLLWTP